MGPVFDKTTPLAGIGDYLAVFEATHGTAPKHFGLDKANPGSLLFPGVMMLEYLGWQEAADLIQKANAKIVAGGVVTYDFAPDTERERDQNQPVRGSGGKESVISRPPIAEESCSDLQVTAFLCTLVDRQF